MNKTDQYEIVGKVKLDYSLYPGSDGYSDGDVEDDLLNIVKEYDAKDYGKVIVERKSWPILYHLSKSRENIINWMEMSKDAKVLEIGAGCGAITGILCEKAQAVHAIELSKRRSLINAYRHRDSDNLEIKVGNFKEIYKSLEEKYDYITLIGVLEYAASYIGGEHPYRNFLTMLKKNLKPDGKIIIAIENRLGLKYFSGCYEDHLGRPFVGINNYSDAKYGVRTFSKKELEELVIEAGYANHEFYYPYPDYKLPTTIYSDLYLPKKGELSNNIRNYDGLRYVLFDETKVFDRLIEENTFSAFSNSFLLILEGN